MTDDPVLSCTRCDAPVQRVFHPVAVHFKGKGFYNTDYGTRRRNRELERSAKDGADKTESKAKDKDRRRPRRREEDASPRSRTRRRLEVHVEEGLAARGSA